MDYDLIVIGSGPAGYVAAIRAGQTGLKTALVEKSEIGGMCLNWGCIPTKALIESAKMLDRVKSAAKFGVDGVDPSLLKLNWPAVLKRTNRITNRLTKGVAFLLKKNGIDIIEGTAAIADQHSVTVDNRRITGKHMIIATGSNIQNLDLPLPEELVLGVPQLLQVESLPEQPVVYGANVHAVELAQFFKLSGRPVSLITDSDRLTPDLDPHLSGELQKILRKNKIDVYLRPEITGYEKGKIKLSEKGIPCDRIINAGPRLAVLPESGIDFERTDGFLKVNEYLQTGFETIYAVGDVNGRSPYAHAASAQALYAVNAIQGIKKEFDFNRVPINMYTSPEMAQIGLTEPQVKEKGVKYSVGEFPLSANGKAMTQGQLEGFMRILSEDKYGEVIGVQIVSPNATDMIGEAASVMNLEGTVYDVAATIHAHPTVSEVFVEAGLDAFGQAIHK